MILTSILYYPVLCCIMLHKAVVGWATHILYLNRKLIVNYSRSRWCVEVSELILGLGSSDPNRSYPSSPAHPQGQTVQNCPP